ncbi:MAG: phytanoyl-CoA dioxygenase family protein, partial [Planctomyces sp.]
MRADFLTLESVEAFDRDGYLVVEGLLDSEETSLLREVAKQDRLLAQRRTSRADGEGGAVELVVENELPADSIYSAIVQCAP